MDAIETGRKLREARGEMSREDAAKALDISVSAVSMYENGQRIPRDEVKVAYAALFHTTVGALFFNEKAHEMCGN